MNSIEDYPYLQTGKIALAPGPTGYLYAPLEPGGIVPAITPPPETVEGYPVFSTMGVAIGLDGGVWQYQGSNGMTEVIPSLPPPTNTALPTLTYVTGGGGAGNVGSQYALSAGTWTPSTPQPVYTRQWMRNENPIPGATATTYTIATADIGAVISGMVWATNPSGTTGPVGSNAVGPIPDPGAADEARLDDNGAPPRVHHGGGSGTLPPRPKAIPRKKR